MSQAMVDRLFWRAGFGPSAADRAAWIGKPAGRRRRLAARTPARARSSGPSRRVDGKPLDPNGNDTDLVLAWVDRMVRAPNPLVERMTFFWHRHWANSRAAVSPTQLLENQNALLRKYGDLAANPDVSFSDMALEVSKDPSMLRYPERRVERQGRPQRELRPRAHGALHARRQRTPSPAPGTTARTTSRSSRRRSPAGTSTTRIRTTSRPAFDSGRWFNGPKSLFGKLGNYNTDTAVDLVLGQDGHAPFIVNKLWGEFMPTPPPTATLHAARGRLHRERAQDQAARAQHPHEPAALRVDRRAQHDQAARRLREPARCARSASASTSAGPADYLDSMGQLPYFPPTVAGWEGGLSWLNTNTALARFGFVADVIGNAPNGSPAKVVDVPNETPAAAFDRAYGAVGSPWMSARARAPRSRTTPRAPRPRPARTASPARSCCARSCSRAQTHR